MSNHTHAHTDDCAHNHTGHQHESSHTHAHHHHHTITNKKKLILVIFLNLIITISEFIGGVLSGSLALVSDAWHNLSDVLALMLGYTGERVSERTPSKNYTFGLKRFEVLIALLNSITLLGIGIYIVYEAIQRFLHPSVINISVMLPVAVIGLIGNGLSIVLLINRKEENLNMKAAFLHLFYDTVSSVAVIGAGIIIYYTKIYWIDLLISLIIVLMLFLSSLDVIRQSLRIFLQASPAHIDSDEIYNSIASVNGVNSVHGLHIWSVNSNEIFLSCHVCIDKEKKIGNDILITQINKMLAAEYGIEHTTLQLEYEQVCSLNGGDCCK